MTADPDALIVAYTDGACSGNPGPGGWAWAVESGPSASGGEADSTNQRMEVQAVLEALRALLPQSGGGVGRVRIVSDSTYVVNCFKQKWYVNWERNGWRNSQKQPVANQDLWKPLIALAKADLHRIEFVWVKGHSGNTMNDLVDRLAVAAAKDAALGIVAELPASKATDEPSQSSLF
jgi:ribonuclease HI